MAAVATTLVAETSPLPLLPAVPAPEVDYYAAGSPHPTYDEFFARVRYPYHAAPEQQRRIERAAHILRVGSTEPQVLKLLGAPDYKAGWIHDVRRRGTKKTVLDEYWHYVYAIKEPSRPDDYPFTYCCADGGRTNRERRGCHSRKSNSGRWPI